RSRAIRAAVLGAVFSIVVIGVASRFDFKRMTFGDGVLHRYVAENLRTQPEQVTRDLEGHGTALRYGRIVMPVLIWTFSAGDADAMRYAQPLLMVASAAAIAAAASLLLS